MEKSLIEQTHEQIDAIEKLFGEIRELQQNRSNFALEKFVVGQHDMPARQRKQVLDELLAMMMGLQQSVTAYEMAQIDIDELSEIETENKHEQKRNDIRLWEKTREVKLIEMQIIGTLRECAFLYALLDRMPKYTREQFEQEEVEYWEKRLTRQARLMEMFGGNMGNVDAILQMYSSPGMPKLPMPIKTKDYLNAVIGNGRKNMLNEG